MSYVETFEPAMIEQALRELDLRPYRNTANEFLVIYTSERYGFTIHAHFTAEAGDDLYVVRLRAGRLFYSDDWPFMLALTNRWNNENAWPHVHLAHLRDGTAAAVDCEGILYAAVGVHHRQVVRFTDHIINTTFQFWDWFLEHLPKQPELPSLGDLNQLEMNLGTDRGVLGT